MFMPFHICTSICNIFNYQTKGINFMKDSNKFAYYFEQKTITNTTGTVTKKLAKAYTKTSVTNCNIKQ